MTTVAEGTAWYVFGVVSTADARALDLYAVEEGELAAVVAPVPLSEYGEDVLPEHLNDREWLEQHARAHQDVLQEVAASAPVVPFRFGTIYRDADDVGGMLRARSHDLASSLARVRGRVELGVKAWASSTGRAAPASAPSGRAYMQQQAEARERARDASAALAAIAQDAHARLLDRAVEGVANRPQPPELTGRRDRMILNGAYLVEDVAGLRAEVDRLAAEYADRGIELELTGPWPPYNFVAHGEDA